VCIFFLFLKYATYFIDHVKFMGYFY